MSKLKPITIGNLVVFPYPAAREAMRNDKQQSKPAPSYNDIQDVIDKTVRSQRYTKTSRYALEKLRKMNLNPA